ncbi:hypothetical protein ACHAXA_006758 [Cyclostephanos tholiformis]|uniref:Uncharacterized protein n=1 Tax=Cyclostephanos tholiformis TaxID=382380 RepID=A0ABD3SSM9_9STRA
MALTRWGRGVTVLLEKIVGNVFVHKLCAICLLEADFNWWNKLVFAKQMMRQATIDMRISRECFARKHRHSDYTVMTKLFFCYCFPSPYKHCTTKLGNTNICNSSVIQMMRYYLEMGFGESEESYGEQFSSQICGWARAVVHHCQVLRR